MIKSGRYIIYAFAEPDTGNIRYIGKSSNLSKRYGEHHRLSYLKKYKNHYGNWMRSILFKNQKAELIIICEYDNKYDLSQAEKFWIKNYRILGCNLVNSAPGGEGAQWEKGEGPMLGKRHSEETIQKMKASHKKIGAPWMNGKKQSKETRQKISDANKGRVASNKGIPMPANVKAILIQTNTGRKLNEETKKKISASNIGNQNALGYKKTFEQKLNSSKSKLILNEKDVAEIISEYTELKTKRKDLAKKYNVSKDTINRILRGIYFSRVKNEY